MKHATIEELNRAQDAFMALSTDAPRDKREKVFADMLRRPEAYLSLSSDGKGARVICGGLPLWGRDRPIAEAKAYMTGQKWRSDLAWNGHEGRWVNI